MHVVREKAPVLVEDNEEQAGDRLDAVGIVEKTAGNMHEIITHGTELTVE